MGHKYKCFNPYNKKNIKQPVAQSSSYQQPNPFLNIPLRIQKLINNLDETKNNILNFTPFNRVLNIEYKFSNLFSKTLPHDVNGYVDEEQMNIFLQAIKEENCELLTTIKLAGAGKLINVSASWSIDNIGDCIGTYEYPEIPKFSSSNMTYQMVELYCMSLCRDVKFSDFLTSEIISDCCRYLNTKYDDIFRGKYPFDTNGLYISQFLFQPMKIGGFIHEQKYATYKPDIDYLKTRVNVISAQNGTIIENLPADRNEPRFLITMRDLATYVHLDEPYQAFTNTIGVLNNLKAPSNPDLLRVATENKTEKFFVNFGTPDIYATICYVSKIALTAAWNVKFKALVARPEVFGLLIDNNFEINENPLNLTDDLLKNDVLQKILEKNGNYLLSSAYPEGSPAHASYPSGHATIAGASATIIKFFYDINFQFDSYKPNENGSILENQNIKTTLGVELNKLVTNIGFGRNMAGIHYRMDAEYGMELGEEVAISCLKDLVYTYPYKVSVSIKKFNGNDVIISN
jgi:membrane-associated phospholipid phosphatase